MKKPPEIVPTLPDEPWTVAQVAAYLGLTYQRARNNMLCHDYGPPEYNAKTRALTVLSSRVVAARAKNPPPKRAKKRPKN